MSLLSVIPLVGKVLDRVLPDKQAREAAKLQLAELEQSGELQEIATKANVVMAEIQGDSWLQKSWRPIVMLWLSGLVGAHWFGFTPENLTEDAIEGLFTLVQLGLGGYVVGRSAEKVAKEWRGKA